MTSLGKPGILFVLLLITTKFHAQNYELTFAGSGASDSVDSVLVENLMQGTTLTMDGSDILHLVNLVTGIDQQNQDHPGDLSVYPNPSQGFSRLEFESSAPGNVNVEIVDISGRTVSKSLNILPAGRHTFQVEGLSNGVYIVNIVTATNSFSGRIVSANPRQEVPGLKYINSSAVASKMIASLKKSGTGVMMQYNAKDLLKFTCFSGIYSTVIMDTPGESKTITSVFTECTDQDNNHYPVVHIGEQTWMAENLKTTHYADGSEIGNVPDSIAWANSNAGNYCFYDDSSRFRDSFGALYNWNAVIDSFNLCPVGWHIPTDAEWTVLETNEGGGQQAGEKMKETGHKFWGGGNLNSSNESGFSGRPAGYRSNSGSFVGLHDETGWWTSTAGNQDSAWIFSVVKNTTQLNRSAVHVQSGYSVRCISGIPGLPVVLTDSIYPIELSAATAGGLITTDGGATITERGVCWSLTANPTIADNHTSDSTGTGRFVSRLTGLTPGATYYVRAYATNATGTSYGADSSFTTNTIATIPIIRTNKVSVINSSSASGGGTVISDGGDEILARGICWGLSANPTVDHSSKTQDGVGIGKFTSEITGLTESATYYIRAYATNHIGTSYGVETTFSIVMNKSGPMLTDVEGNVYKTVYIGNQFWMAENLKTVHFRDGTVIPSAPLTSSKWLLLTASALCYYDNDDLYNKNIYGPLYNWYAVADEHNLCPVGWHVPSHEDWLQLTDYLGGEIIAGGKMKDTGSGLWSFPNTGADNSSGFTALPGGDRDNGEFGSIHDGGGWWSSTAVNDEDAWSHYLYYSHTDFFPSPDEKVSGCSVRCLKD